MADYGSTATGGGGTVGAENAISGFAFTAAGNENLVTATLRLRESNTSNAHTSKIVLYRFSDSVFVAESAARSNIITEAGYSSYVYTFSSVPLTNIAYVLMLYVNSAAGSLLCEADASVGTVYSQGGLTYPTNPDPGTFSSATATPRFYATTTSAGSEHHKRLSLLGVG